MAGDSVTITIRANNGQAIAAFRDTEGRLRDMRGRFTSEGAVMTRSMDQVGKSIGRVRGSLIPLATSAVPVLAVLGASTIKVASTTAGAAASMAAFGIAAAGQIPHLSRAADAQNAYNEAVIKSGRGSEEAAAAQQQVTSAFARMPQATQRAAVQLKTFKDSFREWSDDLAGFTMSPVEKGLVVFENLLPKLTPLVQGASTQLDRLITVAGGGISSPALDGLMKKFDDFATGSMRSVTNGIIHLTRVLSEGDGHGPIAALMDYAAKNGPATREALKSIGDAVVTLAQAAAEAGPGMLALVKAAADLVASLPPELVTILMQTAVGLKLVTLAGAGAAVASRGVRTLGASIVALRAASAGAGGGLAGLRAAFLALGTAAKASIVIAGIALVATAIAKLSNIGREAPPNIDKLTTSLGQLGRSGQVSGEAARLFGKDLDALHGSLAAVADPSTLDNVQQGLVKILSIGFADSTPVKEAKERLDAIDESLTNLVKGGKGDLAKAAFKRLGDEWVKGGGKLKDFKGQLDNYKSALADQKLEQQLAADAMGIFGEAALNTTAKLDAQKQSADGLRASIIALNEVNRSAFDAQTAFEKSIDNLSEAFKKNGATLDADTEAGRSNRDAMSAAAKAHDEMIASAVASGESLGSTSKKSEELRSKMMELATAALGSKSAATELVNSLIGIPSDITTIYKLEREEAISGLEEVREKIQATPDAKSITVSALNAAAIEALEAVGYKTQTLPDGRTEVYTANGKAIGSIAAVSQALNNLDGTTANTYTNHNITYHYRSDGASFLGASGRYASGGRVRRHASGGSVQAFPTGGYVDGPGTGTSDSILAFMGSGAAAMVSNTEYVVRASAVAKYGVAFMDALNAGRLKVSRLAGGGLTRLAKGGSAKAKEQARAEQEARKDARGDLTISHFGKKAGNKNTEFTHAMALADGLKDLVSSLNQWRNIIKKATHGGVEKNLLKMLDRAGASLLKYQKQHDAISKTLEKAKALRDSVASGLKSEAGIVKGAGDSDSRVTINTLLSNMTASAANTKQFSGMLDELSKRGLSSGLIKQIAEAGIEGGGMETAAAILGGGKSEIKRLNDLQKDIDKYAKAAGNEAADAMYGAGMKAGEGIIAGLEKKQKDIEKAMMKIAKDMEKAIKKALGIKSPSTVMEKVGDFTAEGFARGIIRNRSVKPAWQSMLNPPRTTLPASIGGRPGGGGHAGPVEITLSVDSRGAALDDAVVEIIRKAVKVRGGLTAALGGN